MTDSIERVDVGSLVSEMTRIRRTAGASFLTNYFGRLHSTGQLPVVVTEDALVFLDADRDFVHLLFAASGPEALRRALERCPPGRYTLDYVTRSFCQEWEDVVARSGFTKRATYYRIASALPTYPRVTGEPTFAREDEVPHICTLLLAAFDRYLDHLASHEEVLEMVRDRQVLVSRINGAIVGLFVFQVHGLRAHLNHWWSAPEAGPNASLDLLIRAYGELHRRGVAFVHAWVNASNDRVIRIHREFGLVPDGLWNYIYMRDDHEHHLRDSEWDTTGGRLPGITTLH